MGTWDLKLLPLVEQLLAQGHHFPIYNRVWVQRGPEEAPQLLQQMRPSRDDISLDLKGSNRCGAHVVKVPLLGGSGRAEHTSDAEKPNCA